MKTSFYQALKLQVLASLPLSRDALHIYLGMITYLSAGILLKKLASWVPVLFVLALAVMMEVLDLRDDLAAYGHFRWYASVHDIVNSIFWPTVIVIVLKALRSRSESSESI